MDPEEELARLRATTDQANEAVKEMASTLRTFTTALLEEGYTAPEALRLTVTFLEGQMRGIMGDE